MSRFVLTVERGASPGARFELDVGASIVVGRERDVMIRLSEEDKSVSRYHAALDVRGDGVLVRDLGSRQGTFVNEMMIQDGLLRPGDRLRMGRTVMLLDRVGAAIAGTEDDPDPGAFHASHAPAPPPSSVPSYWLCDGCGAAHPQWGAPPQGYGWLCNGCAAARRRERRPGEPEGFGRFEVLRVLAVGGMGIVYEARDTTNGAHAVVKVLLPDAPIGAQGMARFMREQKIAWSLAHPNIVRTFEAARTAQQLYIASEFVTGGDATALLHPRGHDRIILGVMADLFEALGFGHSRGIVHRDVKPQNLLVTRADAAGRVHGKLGDYGIAKSWGDAGGTSITKAGMIAGSLLYMAPEQWLDFKRAGPSADIYSAAIATYHLLTGFVPQPVAWPPPEGDIRAMLTATLAAERTPIRARRPDLPPAAADLVDRLVSRDPRAREHINATDAARVLRAAAA